MFGYLVKVSNKIIKINDENIDSIKLSLKEFFRDEDFSFYDEVMSLVGSYRDYVRKNDIVINTEFTNVIRDDASEMIQDAWVSGDEVLGGTFDTPYTGGKK